MPQVPLNAAGGDATTISLRVTTPQLERLEELARQLGVSRSRLVRAALDVVLARQQSP